MVVISIISLLIALTMPALGRSRENARRSLDLSNIRQFAVACLAYANDYRDAFPYGWRYNWGQDHYRWFRMETWKALEAGYNVTRDIATCNHVNRNSGAPTGDPNLAPALRPFDTHIGWIYWGNREDIVPFAGSQGHVSPKKTTGKYKPSSQTLLTCEAEDTRDVYWSAVAPHVRSATKALFYPGGSRYGPTPEGLHVAYVDSSAAWVAFELLTPIREAHKYGPYATIFYHAR
jgi:type II secretory pathway pseudopilin PulG